MEIIINETVEKVDITATQDVEQVNVSVSDIMPKGFEVQSAVIVETTDSAVTNGVNLLSAYTDAKDLLPNGAALSATNRACVLIPPGRYDLGTSSLTLDTEFVDIIGLTTDRSKQYIFNTPPLGTGGIRQTADDVRMLNFTMESITTGPTYSPDTNLPNTYMENIHLVATGSGVLTTGAGISYAGTYKKIKAGDYAFGYNGETSGYFEDIEAGEKSFCYVDIMHFASLGGTLVRVTAGANSFGRWTLGGTTIGATLYHCRLTSGTFRALAAFVDTGKYILCIDGNDDVIIKEEA